MTAPPAPPPPGSSGRAKLTNNQTSQFIEFQYNPASIGISQSGKIENNSGIATTTAEQQVTKLEEFTITVNDLRMEGKQQVAKTKLLYNWLQPLPSAGTPGGAAASAPSKEGADGATGEDGKGKSKRGNSQVLTLSMGGPDGIRYQVVLKLVKTDFTRFNQAGDPIRAKVSLTMAKYVPPKPKTNPSSGGQPGGRVHLVTDRENLQRIAHDTYHDPGAWRDIAAANDIDDPLRTRNGRSLFLPGAIG